MPLCTFLIVVVKTGKFESEDVGVTQIVKSNTLVNKRDKSFFEIFIIDHFLSCKNYNYYTV